MGFKGKHMLRVFLAEFLGTMLLVMFGDAAIVQHSYQYESTMFLHIALGYGLALMIGILASGGVSGGHLNPAVTLALTALGKSKPLLLPVYWLAQYLGAITGAGIVFGIYKDLINYQQSLAGGLVSDETISGYFATYPGGFDPTYITLSMDQMLGTALLVLIILAVTDEKNMQVPSGLVPLLIGFGLTAIHLSFAANAGCAINPARDFGPRIVTWMAYGSDVWKWPSDLENCSTELDPDTGLPVCDEEYEYFFWVPWILPHIGAILGAAAYLVFISMHHIKEPRQQKLEESVN